MKREVSATSDGEPSGDQLLAEDVLFQIEEIGHADILVGIPCFNNESTIGPVIAAVEAGLRKHFADRSAVICISDGGSADRTLAVAQRAGVGDDHERLLVPEATPVPKRVTFAYRGLPGKGSAFRSIFEVARRLSVGACAVVDSDLRSITPNWLDRLLSPVVHYDYEFVAPVYSRHKYDGTITNCIAYPLTTALYGVRVRQPIGGEFGFSGKLAGHYADKKVWDTDVARFGIDIWMTTVALSEGFRVCQTILGAKIHDVKDPGKDLGPMFRQVVGSLFALSGKYRDRWWDVSGATAPTTFGFQAAYSAEPIEVSVPRLIWKFVEGYVRHHELWSRILSEESMTGVQRAVEEASESAHGFVLDADLWIKIVYDSLIAYNTRQVDAGSLLDSLIPLYFARTATFVQQAAGDTSEEAEQRVEAAVDAAVQLKPYLKRRWRDEHVPDRRLHEQPVPEEGETPEGVERALASGA
ncbi:MAG TPA: glycosyl transferase family 2 [Actinomycetota bacterium]|jgi:glycosyltransferase involved in cell wall biosynthesis|nr:glycosyl transferase family 2 [Actinomycetota bacterium]